MVLVKILKRKDASSLIVAIVIATVLWQALSTMSSDLASIISGLKSDENFYGGGFAGPEADWRQIYLYPAVWALVQITFLEILAWIVILTSSLLVKTNRKK